MRVAVPPILQKYTSHRRRGIGGKSTTRANRRETGATSNIVVTVGNLL